MENLYVIKRHVKSLLSKGLFYLFFENSVSCNSTITTTTTTITKQHQLPPSQFDFKYREILTALCLKMHEMAKLQNHPSNICIISTECQLWNNIMHTRMSDRLWVECTCNANIKPYQEYWIQRGSLAMKVKK